MAEFVIDASSVLAFIFGEPGGSLVFDVARDGHLLISSVNLAEVLARMADKGIPLDAAAEILSPLGMEEVAFDHAQAEVSAMLRATNSRSGLSLGDRCCLALGLIKRRPILTADRKWRDVAEAVGIEITITRPIPLVH